MIRRFLSVGIFLYACVLPMRMGRLLFAALFLGLLLVPSGLGAMLQGTIYDETLRVATNVLVTIDTQPIQRILSTDGNYTFQVPRGNYTISAIFLQDGFNTTIRERVSVMQDGEFTYDLLLFPGLEEENQLYDDITTDLSILPEDPTAGTIPPASSTSYWPAAILIAIILALLIVPVVWLRMRIRALNHEGSHARGTPPISGAPLNQILKILKEEDGRMTQKELRKRLPHSEAKVSLMVAELEAAGKVKKLKSGRGNIIILK
jgi:uncharacterized membrane protein